MISQNCQHTAELILGDFDTAAFRVKDARALRNYNQHLFTAYCMAGREEDQAYLRWMSELVTACADSLDGKALTNTGLQSNTEKQLSSTSVDNKLSEAQH